MAPVLEPARLMIPPHPPDPHCDFLLVLLVVERDHIYRSWTGYRMVQN